MKRKLTLKCLSNGISADIALDSVDTKDLTDESALQNIVDLRLAQLACKSAELYEAYANIAGGASVAIDKDEYGKTLRTPEARKLVEEAIRKFAPKVKPIVEVPFDKDGNLVRYATKGATHREYIRDGYRDVPYDNTWVPNFTFEDSLRLDSVESGMSAKYFIFTSTTTGKAYSMFLNDLLAMLAECISEYGVIKGTWTFRKRGEAYGIIYQGNPVEAVP